MTHRHFVAMERDPMVSHTGIRVGSIIPSIRACRDESRPYG